MTHPTRRATIRVENGPMTRISPPSPAGSPAFPVPLTAPHPGDDPLARGAAADPQAVRRLLRNVGLLLGPAEAFEANARLPEHERRALAPPLISAASLRAFRAELRRALADSAIRTHAAA